MPVGLIITLLIFGIIIGGIVTLYKTANKYKFPDTYDKDKIGYDDEEDDDY
jgi:F0F1-type ATP synthase assembly protein I